MSHQLTNHLTSMGPWVAFYNVDNHNTFPPELQIGECNHAHNFCPRIFKE